MTIFNKTLEVPIIVVFTKYDHFLRNVRMDMLDDPDLYLDKSVSEVAKERFEEYLHPLGGGVKYVQLESELQVICQGHMLMFLVRNAYSW
jgi:hypothetical protein